MAIVNNNTPAQPISQQLLNTMNGTSSSSGAAAAAPDPNSPAALQATFLQLLVTQLQNQDPTNPMDSSQMTSQLAQINTVSGISQLNTTLSSLATQLNATQQVSATGLIGKNVLVPGSIDALAKGVAAPAGVNLSGAASSVVVTITNASGATVKTINLGAQPAGVVPVSWDGTDNKGAAVADGNYNMSVTATANGQAVTASTLSYNTVSSVVTNPDGTVGLALADGTKANLTSVAQIL